MSEKNAETQRIMNQLIQAINPALPDEWAAIMLFAVPARREMHLATSGFTEDQAANLMITWLLTMSPRTVLHAFELEKQAKLAAAIGTATIADAAGEELPDPTFRPEDLK